MKVICVDGDVQSLESTVSMCRTLPQITEVIGFPDAEEAMEWLRTHDPDIAVLDIVMPRMNGMELARRIREQRPGMAILFLTAHAEYALEAFRIHASGFLLKPVEVGQLAAEVAHALARNELKRNKPVVMARTFGNFELLLDGRPIAFERSKSKELLAYLIDRHGSSVTRRTVFAALYEDAPYNRPMQKQLDVMIRSLRRTLCAHGIGDILEIQRGALRVCPERLDCDMYRFFAGDIDAIRAFRGEYMSNYSWSSMTEMIEAPDNEGAGTAK